MGIRDGHPKFIFLKNLFTQFWLLVRAASVKFD
jgi:hypothetical protein